jgi:hypothetical protein
VRNALNKKNVYIETFFVNLQVSLVSPNLLDIAAIGVQCDNDIGSSNHISVSVNRRVD